MKAREGEIETAFWQSALGDGDDFVARVEARPVGGAAAGTPSTTVRPPSSFAGAERRGWPVALGGALERETCFGQDLVDVDGGSVPLTQLAKQSSATPRHALENEGRPSSGTGTPRAPNSQSEVGRIASSRADAALGSVAQGRDRRAHKTISPFR